MSKNCALMLFCCFRQAERSVHQAYSSPSQWLQFVAYYDTKQMKIAQAIAILKDAGAGRVTVPNRMLLAKSGLFSICRGITGLLCNQLKRSWSFSLPELSFFSATLKHLLLILQNVEMPTRKELHELRLDCYVCHYLIGRRLIGIPEIRKADAIEHFNQSENVGHVSFQDICIQNL